MYLKSYGFYNGTVVASQTRDEIFLYTNLPVNGEFPSQRPVTRSFDVWFDLHLNKRLSKQSWGWWVETPSRSLWRHCNADPLNKLFSQKNVPGFFKWLNTIADDDLIRCVARSSASAPRIAPRIQSWCDEAKNIVDCSYFFNFEGCILATQIH